MQNLQSPPLSNEGRQFLIAQAQRFQQRNQAVRIETNTQGSVATGRILSFDNGGLVYQPAETGDDACVTWEKVDKLTGIGHQGQAQTQQQAFSATGGQQQRY